MTIGPIFQHTINSIPSTTVGPIFQRTTSSVPSITIGPIFRRTTDYKPVMTGPAFQHVVDYKPATTIGSAFQHVVDQLPDNVFGTPIQHAVTVLTNPGIVAQQLQSGTFDATPEGQAPFADGALQTVKLAEGSKFVKSDGTVPMLADFDFNNFKGLNLANGVLSTDAINLGQLNSAIAGFISGSLSSKFIQTYTNFINVSVNVGFTPRLGFIAYDDTAPLIATVMGMGVFVGTLSGDNMAVFNGNGVTSILNLAGYLAADAPDGASKWRCTSFTSTNVTISRVAGTGTLDNVQIIIMGD